MALEDMSGYGEVDPGNDFALAATKIEVRGLPRNAVAYVHDDKGAGTFGATFLHTAKVTIVTGTDDKSAGGIWAVTNVLGCYTGWWNGNQEALGLRWYYDLGQNKRQFTLSDYEGGNNDSTADNFWALDTPCYMTFERTAATTFEARIYSDAARTNLLDTLTAALPALRTYRYIEPCYAIDTGTAQEADYDFEDLDLGLAPSFTPYPFSRGARAGCMALSGGVGI